MIILDKCGILLYLLNTSSVYVHNSSVYGPHLVKYYDTSSVYVQHLSVYGAILPVYLHIMSVYVHNSLIYALCMLVVTGDS